MKKTKKYRVKSTGDHRPTTGGHIDFPHIVAFARERGDFTKEENAHFDVCRACRLKLVDALRNAVPVVVRTLAPRAA